MGRTSSLRAVLVSTAWWCAEQASGRSPSSRSWRAGTGKSVLLREIIKALRIKHDKTPDVVAVTASTGIAACNIGGVTLHSFAGIGLGDRSAPELVTKIKSNRKSAGRWLRTKVLIVDESKCCVLLTFSVEGPSDHPLSLAQSP